MKPKFEKFLTRKFSLLSADILISAWNDRENFFKLSGIKEYVKNLEIIDGDFYFDKNWMDFITEKYSDYSLDFFWDFTKKGYVHGEKLKKFAKSIKLSDNLDDLIRIFNESVELLKNLLVFFPETHPLAKSIENKVVDILVSKGFNKNEIPEILLEISNPDKLNDVNLEREELKNIKNKASEEDDFDVKIAIRNHTEKFTHLGYHDPFSNGFTEEFFMKRLNELKLEDNSKNRDYKFSVEETKYISLMKEFVFFRNYRAEKHYEAIYYFEPLRKQISKLLKLNSEKHLDYYTLDETKELFILGKKIDNDLISERMDGFGLVLHNNKIELISGLKLKNKIQTLDKKIDKNININGMISNGGKATGIVKIILNASDQSKFNKNDILVTRMTTPDLLQSMSKAAAFITDEGGITCHAAIVAREMNKPCIIGTKIATKVLKDGDLVEVDANKGIVSRLSSK